MDLGQNPIVHPHFIVSRNCAASVTWTSLTTPRTPSTVMASARRLNVRLNRLPNRDRHDTLVGRHAQVGGIDGA